jgi:sec-independent protein translocase protein TatC
LTAQEALRLRGLDGPNPVAISGEPDDTPDATRMTFWEHIDELRSRLKVVIVVIILLWVIFMTFTIQPETVGSVQVPLLVPAFTASQPPVANQFFLTIVHYLKPSYVNETALAPWDGVLVQIKIAMFLAFVVGFPVIAYEFGRFIGPALKPSEKRLILRMTLPIVLLFFFGVLLDYFILLPWTINFLYSAQQNMGITTFLLPIDSFVSFVTIHLLAFGLAFQLPVIMYSLSAVGILKADFWKKYWRYVTVAVFVIAAIITPDPSGVTMIVVGGIMMGLYGIGYLAARRAERKRERAKGLSTTPP